MIWKRKWIRNWCALCSLMRIARIRSVFSAPLLWASCVLALIGSSRADSITQADADRIADAVYAAFGQLIEEDARWMTSPYDWNWVNLGDYLVYQSGFSVADLLYFQWVSNDRAFFSDGSFETVPFLGLINTQLDQILALVRAQSTNSVVDLGAITNSLNSIYDHLSYIRSDVNDIRFDSRDMSYMMSMFSGQIEDLDDILSAVYNSDVHADTLRVHDPCLEALLADMSNVESALGEIRDKIPSGSGDDLTGLEGALLELQNLVRSQIANQTNIINGLRSVWAESAEDFSPDMPAFHVHDSLTLEFFRTNQVGDYFYYGTNRYTVSQIDQEINSENRAVTNWVPGVEWDPNSRSYVGPDTSGTNDHIELPSIRMQFPSIEINEQISSGNPVVDFDPESDIALTLRDTVGFAQSFNWLQVDLSQFQIHTFIKKVTGVVFGVIKWVALVLLARREFHYYASMGGTSS